MSTEAGFDKLVELIYAAAERPELWPEFLIRSAEAMGARSGNLMWCNRDDLGLTLAVAPQIDPALALEMREWGPRDIWLQHSVGSPIWTQPGRVVESQEFVPDDVVLKSDYYHECLVRLGISQTLACLLFTHSGMSGTLNYYYPRGAGLRTPEQLELARRMTPHVQRALRLYQRVGHAEATGAALAETLDSLAAGFVMMNQDCRPVHMNRAAEAMLRKQDGLAHRNGLLAAGVFQEDAQLRTLVRAAARTTVGAGASSGGVMRVTRPSGRAPWVLTITPVSRQGQLFDRFQAVVVALITDPDSAPLPVNAHLRSIFGFTNAEADVARLLMLGLDRREIADRLLISLNTVRAHLRNLFGKTGTSSQAKLVRMLFMATRMVADLPPQLL